MRTCSNCKHPPLTLPGETRARIQPDRDHGPFTGSYKESWEKPRCVGQGVRWWCVGKVGRGAFPMVLNLFYFFLIGTGARRSIEDAKALDKKIHVGRGYSVVILMLA